MQPSAKFWKPSESETFRLSEEPGARLSSISPTSFGSACGVSLDAHRRIKMWMLNWKALENFPLLMYILAAKTLLLCLAFAGAKVYQRKRLEEKMKREQEERLKREVKKEN